MIINSHKSPNFNERPGGIRPDIIVLHYTGMTSGEAALQRLCNSEAQVSAHYLAYEDGKIFNLVDDEKRAWHAGRSFWRGREGLNDFSIGIEIVNPGHEFGYRNFPDAQIDAVINLCQNLVKKFDIKPCNIVAHSDIAPERKEDPGELFPWAKFAENGVGIFIQKNFECDTLPHDYIKISQQNLSKIGYKIEVTGIFDAKTSKVVAAFQRRYLPEKILICENKRFPEKIELDEKTYICIVEYAKLLS
jgi:N-acetylmuramoyl-L-alanine amidase